MSETQANPPTLAQEEGVKNPSHEYRKLDLLQLLKEIKDSTKTKKIHQLVDQILPRMEQSTASISLYVGEIPRKLHNNHEELVYVFEQIAQAIESIPCNPSQAQGYALRAMDSASRIPNVLNSVRQEGYEEGYRAGLGAKNKAFLSNIDFDID